MQKDVTSIEQVVLVDSYDQVVGVEEKIKAHQLALLHRAFSIFIYRKINGSNSIEMLLQQRHRDKYHCGGLWTNACCGHPRLNENIVLAAQRRLKEEISIEASLTVVGAFQYKARLDNQLTEHEFDHVLIGEYDATQKVVLNPAEAQDFCWIESTQLLENIASHPDAYTPWLQPALTIALEALC